MYLCIYVSFPVSFLFQRVVGAARNDAVSRQIQTQRQINNI